MPVWHPQNELRRHAEGQKQKPRLSHLGRRQASLGRDKETCAMVRGQRGQKQRLRCPFWKVDVCTSFGSCSDFGVESSTQSRLASLLQYRLCETRTRQRKPSRAGDEEGISAIKMKLLAEMAAATLPCWKSRGILSSVGKATISSYWTSYQQDTAQL